MSRLARALISFACLLLPVSGLALLATPASATSTTLCTGYVGCNKLGMSAKGYKLVNDTMYWRMYSGHNCTNYAAFRMVDSGMPNVRPWSGGGNATFWGTENPELTDGVPAVGAVAWWKANVKPAGSAGHVAYVEKVISADEIIVSQDSWGGDFSWARITRSGGSWPSGFIHFNDVQLTNTAKPAVAGTAKVGAVLSASPGNWTPGGATYTYQWRSGRKAIPKATKSTYTVKRAQEGLRIGVRITATKPGFPTSAASSPPTSVVQPGKITNTALPTITGEAVVDATLSASAGSWTPNPSAVTYQWSASGAPIEGATSATLELGPDLVGQSVTVTVTASKPGYDEVSSSSTATSAVLPATFTVTAAPTLSGEPRLGQTLEVDPGTFAPVDADVSILWERDGVVLPEATGSTYLLTEADLGSRIRARVTLARPGYTSWAQVTPTTSRVKTESRLKLVTSSPRAGRARFEVTVTAPGVEAVTGLVRIRYDGEVVAEITLRNGIGHTVLTGLARGHATYVVRYSGDDTVTSTLPLTRTVWVK